MSAPHEKAPQGNDESTAGRARRRIPVPPIPRQRPALPTADPVTGRPYASTAPTQPIPLSRIPGPRRPAD